MEELEQYDTALQEYLKDSSFTVSSDPKFLYLIGKICI